MVQKQGTEKVAIMGKGPCPSDFEVDHGIYEERFAQIGLKERQLPTISVAEQTHSFPPRHPSLASTQPNNAEPLYVDVATLFR